MFGATRRVWAGYVQLIIEWLMAYFVVVSILGCFQGAWADKVVLGLMGLVLLAVPLAIWLAPTAAGVIGIAHSSTRFGFVTRPLGLVYAIWFGALTYGLYVYMFDTWRNIEGRFAMIIAAVVLVGLHRIMSGMSLRIATLILSGFVLFQMAKMFNSHEIIVKLHNLGVWHATGDDLKAIEAEKAAAEAAARAERGADRLEGMTLDEAHAKLQSDWTMARTAQLKVWKDGGYVGPMPTPATARPTPLPRPGKPTAAAASANEWHFEQHGGSGAKLATVRHCEFDPSTYVCKETGDPAKDLWMQSTQTVRPTGGGSREMIVRWKLASGVGHSCWSGECHYQNDPVENVVEVEKDLYSGRLLDNTGRGWLQFSVRKVGP